MQELLHESGSEFSGVALWRTVHAIGNSRLLLESLDFLQQMGLILSVSSDGIEAKSLLGI